MAYPIAKHILPPIIRLFIRRIDGLDNIPSGKTFIAASNHQSLFDDLALPCIIVPKINKKLHIYSNRGYFKNYFLRTFLLWGGAIPIAVDKKLDSKEVNERAFIKAIDYLKNEEIVGIFPEGHRSIDGRLQTAKTGVARLALAAKVPVLPVGIIGSYKLLPKGKALPRLTRCEVKIGRLIYLDEFYGRSDKETLIKATNKIMDSIAELIGQKYEFE